MALWDKIWGRKKEEEEKEKKELEEKIKGEVKVISSLDENYFLVPFISEKSMELIRQSNTYTFLADHRLNKSKLKEIIKKIFNVHPLEIRTVNYKKRVRGVYRIKSVRPRFKKVYVKLKEGEKIPLFE